MDSQKRGARDKRAGYSPDPPTAEERIAELDREFELRVRFAAEDPRIAALVAYCEELRQRIAALEETMRNLTGDGR